MQDRHPSPDLSVPSLLPLPPDVSQTSCWEDPLSHHILSPLSLQVTRVFRDVCAFLSGGWGSLNYGSKGRFTLFNNCSDLRISYDPLV